MSRSMVTFVFAAVALGGCCHCPPPPPPPPHGGHGGPGGHCDGHRPHGPPPEAIAACEGKSDGSDCSVTFGDRTLTGRCVAPPHGAPEAPRACMPEPPPHAP